MFQPHPDIPYSHRPRFSITRLFAVFLVAGVMGCEAMSFTGLRRGASDDAAARELADSHRLTFQETGSPESMRWLLSHEVRPGMSLAEVRQALGDEGAREENDRWIKTGGGHYRANDEVYKWGPDQKGRTYYLVFREGNLVDYNAEEYVGKILD